MNESDKPNETPAAVLARHIAELEHRHKLPVLQDAALCERLSQLPPDTRIPDHVFAALSAVLGFLNDDGYTHAPPEHPLAPMDGR
jgi:type III secretion system FlhB-like substrate exporter